MTTLLKRSTKSLMTLAHQIMPPEREAWGEAMTAELDTIVADHERVRFAFGCLMFSIWCWGRSQIGLVWIGRGLISFGLVSFSAVGVLLGVHLDDVPRVTLQTLCSLYLVGGILALYSLHALRRYAIIGGTTATLAALYVSFTEPTQWTKYYSSVAIESGAVMIGLIIFSSFLIVLDELKLNPSRE